ncbi:unnamed protein product [Ranitomeya imitator]|uniref:Uncharacterized protein n=1 Tax=Ranitomeya imitator TaxID=111125 RepID=A0ABN9MCN8_9NEOB|nr:unnamed protein product [Ranitomeya imitator]
MAYSKVRQPKLSDRSSTEILEAKGLLFRRQGGGTFVQNNLWKSLSDPLAELLSEHSESQFDLLETRVAAYYAALRGTDADLKVISESILPSYKRKNQVI